MNLPAEKNRRILIIDDNRAIHDDFRKILSPATVAAAALEVAEAKLFGKPVPQGGMDQQVRYEIDSAYQGQEGLLLVKQALEAGRPYAMAFVDVRMPPGMDGVETTRKIWELDPDLQVVLCTAYSDYSWGEMFEKLGHHDGLLILKKPFDTVEALQLTHALTEKWWLRQQSRRKMEELEGMVAERTQELAKSLSLLNATLESTADGILAMDLTGKITSFNAKFAALWRFPADLLERRDSAEMVPHVSRQLKDPEKFLQQVKRSQTDPEVETYDLIECRDGRILERYSQPRWIDNQCVGVVVNWRDITERKRAEETLRDREMQLRLALDAARMGTWDWNIQTGRVVWSSGHEALWGYAPGTFPGTHDGYESRLHPDDVEGARRAGQKALDERSNYEHEYRVRWPDGTIRWIAVRGQAFYGPEGKPIRMSGVAMDITERKKAEAALRDSEAFLNTVIEKIPHMIFVKDAKELRFVKFNQAGQALLGYSLAELAGKNDYDLFPKEMADYFTEKDRQVLRGKEVVDIPEEPLQTRNKGERVLHTKKIPVFDNAGQLTHLLGVSEDITERKQLEARLFQSQKMETVGKLAGGIAHEFNSILTAIIGQSELLLGDLPAGSPLAKNAIEISRAADRAATLTRQLLAYGRKQFLRPEALNLNQVITSLHGVLNHLMGGEMVDVNIIPAAGLHTVKADTGQIEQVIINLAMNARDAMPNGGKLTLETANVSFDPDSLCRYPELKPGDYVMLAVTDTGRGMTENIKARVFEPFFTTKDVGQGTGLGLSTCYGIIKQSGGHISVYSEPGRGTTFKIYLPRVEPPGKAPIGRLDSPDLPRGTETILLVEDDPAMREMAAMLLRRLDYTVFAASHGIEALSLCHQRDTGRVDLLFTDVVMPHMSGKELADRVRALYPRTRILFTSAYTENAIVHQGVLDKGVMLLQKPFTPSALARKVREVLDQPACAGPEPATGMVEEAAARRRPDAAQKNPAFPAGSDEVKPPGN